MHTRWISIAAIFIFLGIALGAFGAHALKDRLGPYETSVYEKAVFYHLTQALGLLVVSVLPLLQTKGGQILSDVTAHRICVCLSLGILFFSGSLYVLAITGLRWLGAITPIGGTLFIASWIWLAVSSWKNT
jgi:uncharacterized membrane protein YgdD (TMEM256/DUF423 family)